MIETVLTHMQWQCECVIVVIVCPSVFEQSGHLVYNFALKMLKNLISKWYYVFYLRDMIDMDKDFILIHMQSQCESIIIIIVCPFVCEQSGHLVYNIA